MEDWKKKALKVLKGADAWKAWHEFPDEVYAAYLDVVEWLHDMEDDDRVWFVLLVIEAESG